ncbi:MAG: bifunctional hydroxymethylpyrimidine kinase/phosphomethylpyrimidine kinase, partial [Duncaniella freteri]|nr:bifunctional hydroxymethylpyrimidine kinase/phosphomethylpyrimidine kinase [Duncaniella freteri]
YKVFDINLRLSFYTPQVISDSLARCNVLKINDEELEVVSGMLGISGCSQQERCIALLEKYGLRTLILTCGVNGSYVFTGKEVSFVETPRVDVVDTVGAGDSFTGAFVAGMLSGMPLREAHRLAVDTSAYVCSCAGAMPKLPDSLVGRVPRL